ncbi:LysE family translocator [Afifella pfennigii]|uniref:LysE family translocator n=1 Tax=Afifella pfennigii TaxID=209897 RepID=UPI00047E5A08|nr:LysE family transporter [Afifella pfennigii]
MEPLLFTRSLLLGVAVAAPLGPIGALCISRTLDRGFWFGVSGGLGTAIADALFAALAAFGFAAFAAFLGLVDTPLRVVGGLFMLWLGWRNLTSASIVRAASATPSDLMGTVATTFALTITNPMTILTFAALFAGLGLAADAGFAAAGVVVMGVFLGSLAWWFVLSGGVALAKRKLPSWFARRVSQGAGLVLIAFGGLALISAL